MLRPGVIASANAPVGIICGGGSLPYAVADSIIKQGRRVVLFAIRGSADPAEVARYPHHWLALAQFGRLCRAARKENCRDLVFIGTVVRPALSSLRLDWAALKQLPRIFAMYRGGDNHLLTGIGRVFEEHGFTLHGAHEFAPEILMPDGQLGLTSPSEQDRADIARGLALLKATGPFDVGQAVVVARNHVVAIEGAEGTDQMLARVAEMRRSGRLGTPRGAGVLVKAPKPGQDRRFDLPSVGPKTVEGVAQAGLAGMAVIAGATVVAEPDALARTADRERVFVLGLREDA
ncbi:MAG: LpxI family protein [Pseudorhodoplanes sp.]